jgi:hypothetical protein
MGDARRAIFWSAAAIADRLTSAWAAAAAAGQRGTVHRSSMILAEMTLARHHG